MSKQKKEQARTRRGAALPLAAAALAGGGLVAALFALRGSTRVLRGTDRDTGGHIPDDLALDRPHPGPQDRAPEAFRPNMDAPIPDAERDAFRPALVAAPNARGAD